MTTLSIILAFLLGVAIMVSALHYRNFKRANRRMKELCKKVQRYREADCDETAFYCVKRLEPYNDNLNPELWGEWSVIRVTTIDGYMHHTLIKVFTDDDDDFNKREAEELCDKLNEK